VNPTFLEPKAWEVLSQAENFETYVKSWLTLLCASIAGTERGVVVLRQNTESPYTPIAFWPDENNKTEGLMKAAEAALDTGKGVCRLLQDDPTSQLSYPVKDEKGLRGVVALEVRELNASSAKLAMRLLQWGLNGLLFALQRIDNHQGKQAKENVLQAVLDSVALVLENQGFHKACLVLVTHLASQLNCRRVTLGFVESRHYRIKAISHSIAFSEKMQLSRALEATMTEAGEMAQCLVFPPPKKHESRLYPAHEQLAGHYGGYAICTVPISDGKAIVGALVLERAGEQGFDEETTQLCETAGTMAGLILDLKRENEQGLLKRAVKQFNTLLIKIMGPGYPVWKLNGLLLIGMVVFFSVAQGMFRISANAELEGAVQQSIFAPMNGFITEVPVRVGDIVKQQALLFKLDDTDLLLEQIKWKSQIKQYEQQRQKARAEKKRAEMQVLTAQLAQAKAELELVEKQLARTKGYAPFDGIVINGEDWYRKLGAPVERGTLLFEIAPLKNYQVILQVDEQDIAEIREQQVGNLVLTSTDHELSFQVTQITPISETKEGRNYFRVEAKLDQALILLKPGMKGIGKIEIEERLMIWIWTRGLVNWLRVWMWSWWP